MIKHFQAIATMLFFGALLAAGTAAAQMSTVQRTTHWTINQPTEIPGMVMQPGTYTVKVLNYKDGKEIVQFSNADDTKVIATVTGSRIRQNHPTGSTQSEFTYFQRAAGAPQALKTWLYPGDDWGAEFVYTGEPPTTVAEVDNGSDVTVTHTPQETVATNNTVEERNEQTEEKTEAPAPAPAYTPPPALPQTASGLPLIGLLGLMSLGGAAALHILRK